MESEGKNFMILVSSLQKNKRELLIIITILILSLPAILYLFNPGFPQTDDGNWMVIRLSAFYQALREGEFPVRWLGRLNNGYGYPVSNFLYPGFLYLGIPFAILTSSFITTTKLLFGFSTIASSLGMYLWLRRRFSMWASSAGALIYLYAPYHLYDATVRGSLGEVLALGLAPFVFWSLEKRSQFLTAFFLGLLLISHNTLALLFLPVVIFYQILALGKIRFRIKDWQGILIGIGLSMFFWLPALFDLSSTVFAQTTISEWEKYFAPLSLLGAVQLAVTFIALGIFTVLRKKAPLRDNAQAVMFLLIGLLSLFLSSSFSFFIWKILPVSTIQFPFRFLSLTIFSTAVLIAWIIHPLKNQVVLSIIIVLVGIVTSLPYLFPKGFDQLDEGFYTTNQSTTTIKNEYMPKWVYEVPEKNAKDTVTGNGTNITNLTKVANKISLTSESGRETKLIFSQIYFPGWIATIDNHQVPITYTNPKGLITLSVPKGAHAVDIRFTETPLRLFADGLTLISMVFLLGFGIKEGRKLL